MFHWVLLEIFQCRQAQPQHLEHLDENTMGWCVVFFLSHHRRVPWDHFGLCQIVCITHMHDTSNVLNGLHVKQMARVRKWLQISKVHKSKRYCLWKLVSLELMYYISILITRFKFNTLFIVFLLVGSSSVESVLCFFLWNKKHKSSIWTLYWLDLSTANGIGVKNPVLTNVCCVWKEEKNKKNTVCLLKLIHPHFYTSIFRHRPWVLAFRFSHQQWRSWGQGVTLALSRGCRGKNAHIHTGV